MHGMLGHKPLLQIFYGSRFLELTVGAQARQFGTPCPNSQSQCKDVHPCAVAYLIDSFTRLGPNPPCSLMQPVNPIFGMIGLKTNMPSRTGSKHDDKCRPGLHVEVSMITQPLGSMTRVPAATSVCNKPEQGHTRVPAQLAVEQASPKHPVTSTGNLPM
ncbi:hypothetical protein LIA77_07028 [Sarocladium implicatum]|nr:hypothetical protein LIA77_07028 [Sarocladium implicatum]